MRRSLGVLGSLLLAVAVLLPSAKAVAADNPGCGSIHEFQATVTFPANFWT